MSTPLDPLSPQSHIAVTPPAIRGSPSVLVPRLFKTGSPPPAPISPPPNGNVPAEPPGPSTFSAAQWCFSSSIIRTLRRMKTAGPFLNPVDPLELGIPHYPQVIERPMDFSTIERKLAASNPSKPDPNPTYARYYRVDQFVQDVRLVFANSVKFNGPEHPVTRMGKQVERVFDKQIKQMPPPEEPEAPTPVAGPPLFPPPSSSTSSPPSRPLQRNGTKTTVPVVVWAMLRGTVVPSVLGSLTHADTSFLSLCLAFVSTRCANTQPAPALDAKQEFKSQALCVSLEEGGSPSTAPSIRMPYWRKPSVAKLILKLDTKVFFVPSNLEARTQIGLRQLMDSPPSDSDEWGYIYALELRDAANPNLIHIKVGV
ncbi:hypothetical protein GSI_09429 [Ganoderma sinense ZZ0214-1]|uniref:Bromo domain-containing protein n=1 Tax=Ganoderma sinense ZZ0214-1 TaxID=1077348 RepID=A0A2G8S6L9_9APHY|nr:hypothetical protein GSI_09429 [Ganoderma sinense ZZ0214-1]